MKNNEVLRRLSGGKLWLAVAALAVGILLIIMSGNGEKAVNNDSSLPLEEKLCRLCERVNGVSEVTVAVSLDGDCLSGVGVVCVGGNDPRIQRELTELISVACGIGSNKIFITGAEKSSGPS